MKKILILLIYSVTRISAKCNECDSHRHHRHIACIEFNAYKACSLINGSLQLSGDPIYCHKGSVCSADSLDHPCVLRTKAKQTCQPEIWSDDFCQENTSFRDPLDSTCQKYMQCVLVSGVFKSKNLTCPNNKQFSESLQKCVATKIAGCLSSSKVSTNYTVDSKIDHTKMIMSPKIEHPKFRCTELGLFKQPWDETCTVYIRCTLDTYRTYKGVKKTCSTGTQFNSILNRCERKHQPGCPDMNRIDQLCHGRRLIKARADKTCSQYYECQYRERTKSYRIIKHVCPVFQQFSVEKQECSRKQQNNCPPIEWCSYAGKFPDPDDLTCRRFIRCMEDYQSLYGVVEQCEGSTQFDKKLQNCTNVQQLGCPPLMGIF